MLHVGRRKRRWLGPAGWRGAALAPGVASAETLTDPVVDNCRNYPGLPGSPDITGCGPDISQAAFTSPGDGNLHVNVSYASLPSGPPFPQLLTYIELGIYPKTATTPQLAVGSHRFSNFGGTCRLQLLRLPGPRFSPTAPRQRVRSASSSSVRSAPEATRPTISTPSTQGQRRGYPQHPDLAPNTVSSASQLGGGGWRRWWGHDTADTGDREAHRHPPVADRHQDRRQKWASARQDHRLSMGSHRRAP